MAHRKKRLFCIGCMCSILLTGCGIRMPVVVPDNQNVLRLVSDFLFDRKTVSGSFTESYVITTGSEKNEVSVQGSFEGNLSGISQLMYQDSEKEDIYYYDCRKDRLYEVSSGSCYTDAEPAFDFKWWKEQIGSGIFKYSGTVKSDSGTSVFLLDRTYTGTDLKELLSHLHVDLSGSVDTSNAGMTAVLSLDRWTGKLYEIQVRSMETGSPILLLDDAGVVSQCSGFALDVTCEDYKGVNVRLPKECKGFAEAELPASLNALSFGGTGFVKDGCLVSPDRDWLVQYGEHGAFDVIQTDESGQFQITPSQGLTGFPVLTLCYMTGLNAYDSAVQDCGQALQYYNDVGLGEISVDTAVTQTSVNGYPGYYYKQQYTEINFDYVEQDYVVYVDLSDDEASGESLYLKCVLTSMVDRGMNPVLNEAYLQSVLEPIMITNQGAMDE